jgi:hypothetical protein
MNIKGNVMYFQSIIMALTLRFFSPLTISAFFHLTLAQFAAKQMLMFNNIDIVNLVTNNQPSTSQKSVFDLVWKKVELHLN